MTPLIDSIWEKLTASSVVYGEENPHFAFQDDKKELFAQKMKSNYRKVKDEYMTTSVENLDRHKVAAIIVISALEAEVIGYKDLDNDYVFIGAELIALNVGLSYMIDRLNERLDERQVGKRIQRFVFPDAQSCSTPCAEIICRNLYYAKRDYGLNPIDLAERFFLLEYITLMKEGIDPNILKYH